MCPGVVSATPRSWTGLVCSCCLITSLRLTLNTMLLPNTRLVCKIVCQGLHQSHRPAPRLGLGLHTVACQPNLRECTAAVEEAPKVSRPGLNQTCLEYQVYACAYASHRCTMMGVSESFATPCAHVLGRCVVLLRLHFLLHSALGRSLVISQVLHTFTLSI